MTQTLTERLLIISHDVIGSHMAGPGVRYWEMARTLHVQQPVTLIAPRPIYIHETDLYCGSFTWGDAASLAEWLESADIVVANGFVLQAHPELAQISQPLVIDLYDPVVLENLELFRSAPADQRVLQYEQDRSTLNRQLAAGDFFLCATERQRDLYIGALLAAGRVTPMLTDHDPQLRRLIDVVPFGLPAEPPVKQQPALRGVLPGVGPEDTVLLWAGGLWDWMDPLTLLEAMPWIVEQHPTVRLVFLAGQHPAHDQPTHTTRQAQERAVALGLRDSSVFFYPNWVPYSERADFLLEADIAISLHRDHLETRYAAVRSRILDHLWAGLPSFISAGDPASTLLQAAGAAVVVPTQQPDALAAALDQLLVNQEQRAQLARAAHSLAAGLTWEQVLDPLKRFCAAPRRTRLQEPAPTPTPVALMQSEELPTTEPAEESAQPEEPAEVPPAPDEYTLLEQCRNAAVDVQEQTWQVQERPLGPSRLNPPRQKVIEQVVRPYVVPLLEQQRIYNAAVLRSIYAMNQIADYQRNETFAHIRFLHHRGELLESRLDPLEIRTQVMEEYIGATQRDVGQLQASVEPLQQRMDQLEIYADQVRRTLNPLLERIDTLEHNNRVLHQQLSELIEQATGLEDADTQLLAAMREAVIALSSSRQSPSGRRGTGILAGRRLPTSEQAASEEQGAS